MTNQQRFLTSFEGSNKVTVNASPSASIVNSLKRPYRPQPKTGPTPLSPESLVSDSLPPTHPQPPSSAAAVRTTAPAETAISTEMPVSHLAGHPRLVHSRPPLRFDRTFLEERSNQLKLLQMFCGLFALVLTINCWPNRWSTYCIGYLWDFWQLFNAVCVHGFFLIGTTMLALAHLFCVPDAFYHYNFPLLEKFYTALALAMYLLASFFSLYSLSRASFTLLWVFPVAATLTGFALYFADFWTRFRRDREEKAKNPQQPPYIT